MNAERYSQLDQHNLLLFYIRFTLRPLYCILGLRLILYYWNERIHCNIFLNNISSLRHYCSNNVMSSQP